MAARGALATAAGWVAAGPQPESSHTGRTVARITALCMWAKSSAGMIGKEGALCPRRIRSMEAIVVQKYGGSSVADPDKLGKVADRVAATVRAGRRVVVVV